MGEHWWRAYDGSIDHPKLLRLSDAMHRAWFTLQCIASANGGVLPSAADIALRLRMKPSKVGEWITLLVGAGLIDRDGDTFRPHNWDERQYKTDTADPTAASRAKKYRDKRRDGKRDDRDATVTDKRPDTDTEKKDAAPAAPDPEVELFRRGREVLGKQAGGLVAKLLTAKQKNVALARAAIEQASTKSDPREYVARIANGPAMANQPAWIDGIEGVL